MSFQGEDVQSAHMRLKLHPARHRFAIHTQTVLCVCALISVVVLLMAVFGIVGQRIATQMCVNVAAVVALGVFCGNSGIISFGHGSFILLGAYLSGILTMPAGLQGSALPMLPAFLAGHELSFWVAAPIVALAGFGFAALSGSAITRLVGASATIATLGFMIITHSVAIAARELTRGSQTFYGVPRLTDLTLALGFAVVFIVIARFYRESRWGLTMRAVRDNPQAAQALGIDQKRARFIAWCLSGTLSTLAGALYGHLLGAFSPASFFLTLVFTHVAMLIVGGMTTVGGAVAGVLVITLLQDTVRQIEGGVEVFGIGLPAIFGLTTISTGLAILFIIWKRPKGMIGDSEVGPAAESGFFNFITNSVPVSQASAKAPDSKLIIKNISKHFNGIVALKDIEFEAPVGQITGLIGPNGAGKSTLVNILTRAYDADPADHQASFGSTDLLSCKVTQISRSGVARTFQNLRLFDGLTVFENVLVSALASGLNHKQALSITIRELIAFDLGGYAAQRAESLPYGARKRLEIARSLAQDPAMILLDEPAAGMNPAETDDLANRLKQIENERGIGMILIEHDLHFVNRLSTRIVVMNRGQVIAEGTPQEIRENSVVIEAYIGRGRTAEQAKKTSQPQSIGVIS